MSQIWLSGSFAWAVQPVSCTPLTPDDCTVSVWTKVAFMLSAGPFITALASRHKAQQDLDCDTGGSGTQLRSLLTSINVTFIFWIHFSLWLWRMHRWYRARGVCCCLWSDDFRTAFFLWCCSPMRSLIWQSTVNYPDHILFTGEHITKPVLLSFSVFIIALLKAQFVSVFKCWQLHWLSAI